VARNQLHAISLYRRFGFRETGVQKPLPSKGSEESQYYAVLSAHHSFAAPIPLGLLWVNNDIAKLSLWFDLLPN
jgi:hypothetical protein